MYRMYVYLSGVLLLALTSGALGEVPGWWSLDINTTGGSATEQNGTITITADGVDIWGNSDEFHYVYKQLSGDGHIAARFVDFGPGSNAWAKAGVMIRETLEPGSPHAMMALTGGEGGGAAFQWRSTQGGQSQSADGLWPPIEWPVYVSIVRQGDRFSGWTAPPGGEWVLHGVAHGHMIDPVLVGLAVTSRAPSQLCTVTFDHVQLGGHVEGTVPGHPCVPVFTIVDTLRLDPLPPPWVLPNGRCTLHSDGWQCEVPQAPQDMCSLQALWLDISPAAAELIYHDLFPPGDGPGGFTVYASPGPPPPGPYVFTNVQFQGEIVLNDPTHFYQYAVVFDADGQTSNNYVPWPGFPNDSFGGTDKWYEVTYGPDSGWEFWVTDVRQDFAEVQSNAWVTIASSETSSEVGWFVPLAELDTDTPTFRATAFAHTGDWGMFGGPWSMDYYPLVGDSLLPVTGPVYTPLSGPPEIKIDFEEWTVGTLFDKDSFLQFYPELEGYVKITTEGPLFQVVDTGDGKVLQAGAGAIGDNECQSCEIGFSSVGGGTFSFRARTSSEKDYDELTVSVNEEVKHRLSGETEWTSMEFILPEGSLTAVEWRWRYCKNGSVSEGEDKVEVDDIDIDVELLPLVGLTPY